MNISASRIIFRYTDNVNISVADLVLQQNRLRSELGHDKNSHHPRRCRVGGNCHSRNPTEADAPWRRYRPGFPTGAFITGIATGTLIGAALAAPRHYGAYAYEPVYLGARCYVRRERVRDRRGWHVRRVIEVCY